MKVIQNGRANMADMKKKLHIGSTILIKRNFKLLSVHIQMFFFESTWVFQSRLHHLKWQLQNSSHVKQHQQRRKKSVAKTKLFHKYREICYNTG